MSFWEPHNGANGQNVLKEAKTGGEIQKSVTANADELKLLSVGSTSDHVISQHPASFVLVAPTDVKIWKR